MALGITPAMINAARQVSHEAVAATNATSALTAITPKFESVLGIVDGIASRGAKLTRVEAEHAHRSFRELQHGIARTFDRGHDGRPLGASVTRDVHLAFDDLVAATDAAPHTITEHVPVIQDGVRNLRSIVERAVAERVTLAH